MCVNILQTENIPRMVLDRNQLDPVTFLFPGGISVNLSIPEARITVNPFYCRSVSLLSEAALPQKQQVKYK